MTWIDSLLSSSAIVYILLAIFIIHIYLKKTGKTFIEMINGIGDSFNELGNEKKK